MLAMAGIILLSGAALAQPAQRPAEPCSDCPQGGGQGMMTGPQLTEEQERKMDELRLKHIREVMPLMTDLQVKEIELAALWRADDLDAAKILAKVKEINEVRNKLQLARVNQRLARYQVLTKEQRQQGRRHLRGMGRMRGMGMRGMQGMGPEMGRGMGMGCGNTPSCPMHDGQSGPPQMD